MIAKVCGIETEYGILTVGAEQNPVLASGHLIAAYLDSQSRATGWDFSGENPGVDARADSFLSLSPETEPQMLNAVLRNGARFYVDHAHPEISTPECSNPLEVVLYDRAAEEIVRASASALRARLDNDVAVVLYKNNSDGKGNSYGCHENYLVQRSTPFNDIALRITPHFVTRQIFCGAGKIGLENAAYRRSPHPLNQLGMQISQRADFFEAEIGLETTLKRPIVNTRDEPHCDPKLYRRLHVICGDANMSETATFLKVASTCVLLAMIEDGEIGDRMDLRDPVLAVQDISTDTDLVRTVETVHGESVTALEVQTWLCESALRYLASKPECIGELSAELLIDLWPSVLGGLKDRSELALTTVDWIAKERLVTAYAERHRLSGADARLRMIDLQYHDMRPEKCLASRASLATLVDFSEVVVAMNRPPLSTRAFFRGMCVAKWPDDVASANWDSVVVTTSEGRNVRIPLAEPLRANHALTNSLFDSCQRVDDLV